MNLTLYLTFGAKTMDVYKISLAAKMSGLTEFTLRAWERRHRAIKPRRSPNGRRVYSLKEIEKLKLLKILTDAGHSISEVANLDHSQLVSLAKKTQKNARPLDTVSLILKTIENLDLARLIATLKSAQRERDTRSFLIEVISPTLSNIGRRVEVGSLEIFREHFASAAIRNLLTGILYSVDQVASDEDQPAFIFATPEGDHHEFGVLIAAILAALRGPKVFYLGPNMPADSLVRATNIAKARVLVIGCSAPRSALSTADWKKFASLVATSIDPDTKVWIGGNRLEEIRKLRELSRCDYSLFERFEDFETSLLKIT